MEKFLKALQEKYHATLESGGKHPKIVFQGGKKVTYSHSAKEVADYLLKEIAVILSIPKKELRQSCS